MKVLIDATNLYAGGGVQVAVSFIYELQKIENFDSDSFVFAVSPIVYSQLIGVKNLNVIVFNHSPSSITSGYVTRKKLRALSEKSKIVFSVFGPVFWKPQNARHIVGFANPWIINKNHGAYSLMPLTKRISSWIKYKIYLLFFTLNADSYVVETKDVANKLSIYTEKEIFVVPNCYASIFNSPEQWNLPPIWSRDDNTCYLLCLGHSYTHKNYDVVGDVARILNTRTNEIKYKFIFTLDDNSYDALSIKTREYSINIGRIKQSECPELYNAVDGVFLPTLLECFSANYPESMIMEKPIFTSNRDFAKSLCLEYANYFDPFDSENIASVILEYYSSPLTERKESLRQAKDYVNSLPDAKSRAKSYLQIISNLISIN